MKRKLNYLIALALMAFTFTSCEDVPSPFGEVVPPKSDDVVVIEPSGTGTEADPFNIAGVIEYVSGLGADVASPNEVYFKGYITSITEAYGTQYGNATFEVSDTKDGGNKFLCYRVKYFNNQGYSNPSDPNIKEGDLVVMCGKVVNYRGNTPETSANAAWLYSLNGTKGSGGGGGGDTPTPPPSGDAKGTGSQADPYNAAGANKYIATLAADAESPNDVYIKGKFVKYANNGEFNAQYGNASFYISDDGTESGEQFYVFRTLYLGNVKYTEGVTPKAGDDVVICGKVVNYKGNTPETSANKSYLYSLNGNTAGGGGGDTGGAKGTGTQNDPFNIAAAIAKCQEVGETASSESYYIKGIADAEYTVGSYKNVEIDIVDTEGSSDKFKVFRVKDKDGKGIKEGYKIPKGATIIVYGPVVNYKGNTPETATGAYLVSVNGKAPEVDGDSGSGGGETGGNEITAVFGDLDCSNIAAIKLSDGTTIALAQEDGKSAPIYHESTKILRLYARNSITVNAGSKKIAKVIFAYDTYNGTAYKGNDEMYGEGSSKITPTKDDANVTFSGVNSSTLKVVNWLESGNSGGTQFRVSAITIQYQ